MPDTSQPANSQEKWALEYLLKPGNKLSGSRGHQFVIQKKFDEGNRGLTFIATQSNAEDRKVIIKLPLIKFDRTLDEISQRIGAVLLDLEREVTAWSRLRKQPTIAANIADVIDFGMTLRPIKGRKKLVPFLVQEFIEGKALETWCEEAYGTPFNGIKNVKEWFRLCGSLTEIIGSVHQERVVHGDIWPDNIRIRPNGDPVLIDFGQAWLLDQAFRRAGTDNKRYPYYAPERQIELGGNWYAPADIYGLGGVMFYLATGQTPPSPIAGDSPEEFIPNRDMKDQMIKVIRENNPALYEANQGIADIILYCMRPHVEERATHAGLVQECLNLFDTSFSSHTQQKNIASTSDSTASEMLEQLDSVIYQTLKNGRHPFYPLFWREINALHMNIRRSNGHLYTIEGNRDDKLSSVLATISSLKQTDSLFALTTPLFWMKQNFGMNGRLITMLKMAVLHGVSIRWVTVGTEVEFQDPGAQYAILSQARAIKEVSQMFEARKGTELDSKSCSIDSRGFYMGFRTVDEAQRRSIVRSAGTFLIVKQPRDKDYFTLIAPTYTKRDGQFTVIRYWSDPVRWEDDLKRELVEYLDSSTSVLQFAS